MVKGGFINMDTQMMTLEQIRLAGLEALARELGPVGMIRFLQQFNNGKGDYSKERHKWLDKLDVTAAAKDIQEQRKKR
jgi:hypothetical protein